MLPPCPHDRERVAFRSRMTCRATDAGSAALPVVRLLRGGEARQPEAVRKAPDIGSSSGRSAGSIGPRAAADSGAGQAHRTRPKNAHGQQHARHSNTHGTAHDARCHLAGTPAQRASVFDS